jgi:hypothetical protein
MDYNIILYYVQDLYGLSRPTVQGGTHNGVIVLLSTHHIFHYIALKVAMFLSLNVFSQIYELIFYHLPTQFHPKGTLFYD